ncbi:hypothetical protein K501DRAFT_336553 [Backusella circina FSU 941]|nr:hypothetical protein K501DRAFT_336553 [Backusella circina FSU 941]
MKKTRVRPLTVGEGISTSPTQDALTKAEEGELKVVQKQHGQYTENISNSKSRKNVTKHSLFNARSAVNPKVNMYPRARHAKPVLPADTPSKIEIKPIRRYTREDIKKLIGYVVDDKMTMKDASRKAKMSPDSGWRYYRKYKDDPNHQIPIPRQPSTEYNKSHKQEQIDQLIGYIINDKIGLENAAKKANMSKACAEKYYQGYLEGSDFELVIQKEKNNNHSRKRYTGDQIKQLISSVANDKLSVTEAAKRINMSSSTGYRLISKYLMDPTSEISSTGDECRKPHKLYTNDEMKQLISYIANDKLSIAEAAKRVNIDLDAATKYFNTHDQYQNYDTSDNHGEDDLTYGHQQEAIQKLINYIVVSKNSIRQAAKKAGMSHHVATKYYKQYLSDPEKKIPSPLIKLRRSYSLLTKEKLIQVIGYHNNEKMTIREASEKTNVCYTTVAKYYRIYKNDPNHQIPQPFLHQNRSQILLSDEHYQFILDLYRNNPETTYKEAHNKINQHFPGLDVPKYQIEYAIRKKLPEIANIKASAGLVGFRFDASKVKPKHVEYIKEIYTPNMTVSDANERLSKAFPGFSIHDKNLYINIKRKCGIELLGSKKQRHAFKV